MLHIQPLFFFWCFNLRQHRHFISLTFAHWIGKNGSYLCILALCLQAPNISMFLFIYVDGLNNLAFAMHILSCMQSWHSSVPNFLLTFIGSSSLKIFISIMFLTSLALITSFFLKNLAQWFAKESEWIPLLFSFTTSLKCCFVEARHFLRRKGHYSCDE